MTKDQPTTLDAGNVSRATSKAYKKRYPLESFDPRYKQLLLRGAIESVELRFPSPNKAIEFQRRAWIFRIRSKEAGVADWQLLFRCKLVRRDNVVTFSPYDSEFSDIFAQAGLGSEAPEAYVAPNLEGSVEPESALPRIPKEFLP